MAGLGRNATLLREKIHAVSWGKTGLQKGAGPPRLCRFPAPNRFLAHFHNRQLVSCHYLLSRRQGEQAECMSWSAAVSAASRTGTKQASGNVLKKERGGKIEEEREEDGGAGSLRRTCKGQREETGQERHGQDLRGRKGTRLHRSKRCHWSLGVIPAPQVSAGRNVSPAPSQQRHWRWGAEGGGAGLACGLRPAH